MPKPHGREMGDKGGWVCVVGTVEIISFLLSFLSKMFLLCDNHLPLVIGGLTGWLVDLHRLLPTHCKAVLLSHRPC